jgi:choline kinase
MRAIILAAGAGRRLAPMNWDKPKCLLPCPQGTLLDNALDGLSAHAISEVVVIAGYRRRLLNPVLGRCFLPVQVVVNKDFATTNTIHSLWLARRYMDRGCLLINGDVWFEHAILDLLFDVADSALAVDIKPCGPEEVKVVTDAVDRILRVGKDIPPADAKGESVGLVKLTAPASGAFAQSLDRFDRVLGRNDLFYESALDAVLGQVVVRAAPMGKLHAVEIDTPEDYQRAQAIWERARR